MSIKMAKPASRKGIPSPNWWNWLLLCCSLDVLAVKRLVVKTRAATWFGTSFARVIVEFVSSMEVLGHHRKQRSPMSMTDIDLPAPPVVSHLENLLQRRLRGQVRQLRVLHLDDGLVLQGYSSTYYAKQLAQHMLLKETILPLLSNEIQVI
jgi:hypothetical protein